MFLEQGERFVYRLLERSVHLPLADDHLYPVVVVLVADLMRQPDSILDLVVLENLEQIIPGGRGEAVQVQQDVRIKAEDAFLELRCEVLWRRTVVARKDASNVSPPSACLRIQG